MRRVRPRVHGLQALDRDVRVDLRRRELRVAQDLLEIADVGAGVVHQGRHRVAEDVDAPGFLDSRSDQVLMQPVGELRGAEPGAAGTQEERFRVPVSDRSQCGALDQFWPHEVHVALGPADGAFTDRDQPVLLALALADQERPTLAVEIGVVQADELHPADAGRPC